MKKDIKIGIIMLIVSVILLSFGILVATSTSFETFIHENSLAIKFVPAFLTCMCVFCGFIGTFASIIFIIPLVYLEHLNRKAKKDKHKHIIIK